MKKGGKPGKGNQNKSLYKKKKGPFCLFLTVLAGILACGGLALAFLYGYQLTVTSKEGTVRALKTAPEKTDGTKGSGQDKKSGSLLDKLTSEELLITDMPHPSQTEVSRYGALLSDEKAMEEQKIHARVAAADDRITMAFGGDILFDESYAVMASLQRKSGKIEDAFSPDLLKEMQAADIFMVNNEFTYTDRGTPLAEKQFTFRAKPEYASYLLDMGVDIVSLANNHVYDYGEISLLDTLDILENLQIPVGVSEEKTVTRAEGMPYVGAGRNLAEAVKPAYFIINDTKIAFVSATQIERNDNPDTKGATDTAPGTFRCFNVNRLLEVVKEAKENSDFVVVYIHWGTENEAQTDWAQKEQAPQIAAAGADIIIGDHPHCLQPVEFVNGVPVIYSLGNFWFNSKSLDTCLVKVTIPSGVSKEAPLVQILPARQENCFTFLAKDAEKTRILEYLNSISAGAYLDEEGYLLEK